ncbi:hypothetical protein H0H87_005405 [Tephrocybe sp. NHM501043]|nr:hypothetical protein H0H87_005405 [Tephrocybe sp. NHM501043]
MARGGTPLGFGAPSLEASNQAQIDDLVQRNRTLDHTNKKLVEQINFEKSKAGDTITEIQQQWAAEQVDWLQGRGVLQSCHRIVQLRNVMQIEEERQNVLKAREVAHKERFLRMQREFDITILKVKEAELMDRIQELEEEREAIITNFEAGENQLDQRIANHIAQLHAKDEELAISEQEKENLQDKLAELNESCARLQATGEKLTGKLERVTLQRDGAVTTRDELKNANEELTRSKTELLRQIEKWQTLETKGGAEAEAERKKRVELDVKVRELQSELESTKEQHEKLLRKETRKVEKLKEANESLQVASEKHEEESETVNSRLAKAERRIEKLKAALEAERARVRSPSPQSPPQFIEDDPVPQPSPPREPSPKPKPRSRRTQNKPPSQVHTVEATNAEAGPSGTNNDAAKKRKRRVAESDVEEIPQPKSKEALIHDSDIEEVSRKPKSNNKGKTKATERSDGEVEIAPLQVPPNTRRKHKRKEADAGDDGQPKDNVDEVDTRPSTEKKRPPEEAPKTQRKPPSRMGSASVQLQRDGETSDAEKEPAKKKRRKINIFPASAEPFSFEAIGGGNSGLNIPTSLSPLKEPEKVPNRSTSGSVLGYFGSALKASFRR